MTTTLTPGTRVRLSDYATRRYWDDYQKTGRTAYRKAYDRERARLGTIIEPDPVYTRLGGSVSVQWDDGSTSHCLTYMVEAVTCPHCAGPVPRGYHTCGKSECQEADYHANVARNKKGSKR